MPVKGRNHYLYKKMIVMKRFVFNFCLFSAVVLLSNYGLAQTQTQQDTLTYHVETTDGNKYNGKIVEKDEAKIVLMTEILGEISIPVIYIKEIQPIESRKMKDGQYWMENPQATRYFFSPNGYGLKGGEGYYQNVWVLFNSFAVGVTDYISLGGGIVPLFLFAGTSTPVWFTPKFSIPVVEEKFNVGGGALLGTVIGEENAGFGILYGITTFGSKDKNVSLGLGYGYAAGDWASSPMINLNFMIRTGARGYFISENYYLQVSDTKVAILSLGGRRIIQKAGLDYGLFIPISNEIDTFVAFPWLGITIPFGNKKKQIPSGS